MKKSKKFLCLLLALVMAGSLLLLPAAAANTQQSGAERYPTVYVHGLMGWGARDQIYAVTPYWGLTRPDLRRDSVLGSDERPDAVPDGQGL